MTDTREESERQLITWEVTMLKQVDGVFKAICAIRECDGFDAKVELTKDETATVVEIVTKGIATGEIYMSERARAKYATEDEIGKYVDGMVNNHLRKDLRLNGGTPYQPKNPGSRAGAGDETIKAMKALRGTLTDPEEIALVDGEIEKRLLELKAAKAKTIEIDASVLPEDLKHLVNS